MRFHRLPENLLSSPARVAVLRTLLRSPGREWTGREVARASGVSPPQAIEALHRLYDEALVHQRRVGRARVWTLDQGHYLAAGLSGLFEVERKSMEELLGTLRAGLRGSGALEAYLYGSVARGDEDPNSDVDLLVVFPDKRRASAWRERLRNLEAEILGRFGNPLQALVYTSRQVRSRAPGRIYAVARREGRPLEVG